MLRTPDEAGDRIWYLEPARYACHPIESQPQPGGASSIVPAPLRVTGAQSGPRQEVLGGDGDEKQV